jgi:phosphoglycolate phosphatase
MLPQNKCSCRLFIFDLDGTLIDSQKDIVNSLNRTLQHLNMEPIPEARIAEFVGDGMQKLIERALCETTRNEPEQSLMQTTIRYFREEYSAHLLDQTCLFHQAKEALDRLSWAQFAVATNKPEAFSRRILSGLGIEGRFSIILGGDSIQKRKPDPESLIKAMDFCRSLPSETVMVGDSAVDIRAGKAAGTTTCGILGGFRPAEELQAANCDLLITSLLQLADHFSPPK